jgi:hypothetical protein
MINHLRLKMAIRMTTGQKYEYKMNGYNTPWDPTMSTTAYFSLLDCFQVLLGNSGITSSNKEKMMAAGAQMWQSEMFTEDQMVIWAIRGVMAQTWAALRHTSQRSGWSGSNTWQRQQHNRDSRRQRYLHKRQQQQKRKAKHRRCCLQCCRTSTQSRSHKWRQ